MATVVDPIAARNEVERAVNALLGPDELTSRPVWPGASTAAPAPGDWTEAITAARAIHQAADRLMHDYACRARGEGRTWADVADVLGELVDADTTAPDTAAFASMARDGDYVVWTCTTCGATVTDYGPYDANPANAEAGHTNDCARHCAEVAAYDRGSFD